MAGRSVPTLRARAARATRSVASKSLCGHQRVCPLAQRTRVLTSCSTLWAVWRSASEEALEVLRGTGVVGRAEGAAHAVNITVQLDIADVLRPNLRLALAMRFDPFAGAANESGSFLETVDVLSIRTKQLPF